MKWSFFEYIIYFECWANRFVVGLGVGYERKRRITLQSRFGPDPLKGGKKKRKTETGASGQWVGEDLKFGLT